MSVPAYRGRFGAKQAERLLWRAGFGPAPGQAAKLARKGLRGAVHSLTRPHGKPRLKGPEPHGDDGLPLAPTDAWGHDLLWWLDRMVRSDQSLVERMTLTWHDWFATADVGQVSLNLDQNQLFRKHALGSFENLLLDVTTDPAMLVWLSGNENEKEAPNENYGREMMELFTLGASNGYTEDDVREQARALTGWTNDWDDDPGDGRLPVRGGSPRRRQEADLRQGRELRLARLVPALHRPPRARRLLRRADLVLLHPGAAVREDAQVVEAALPARPRDQAGGRGRSSCTRASTRDRGW